MTASTWVAIVALTLAIAALAMNTIRAAATRRARRDVSNTHRYTIEPPVPTRPSLCTAFAETSGELTRCILITNIAGEHNGDHVYGDDTLLWPGGRGLATRLLRAPGTNSAEEAQDLVDRWKASHHKPRQEWPSE